MSRLNIDASNRNQPEDDSFLFKVSKTGQKFYEKSGNNPELISSSLHQFEMKFDSLKGYVDSITSAVNQHATLINKLRTDYANKLPDQNVQEAFTKLANCMNIKELDTNFMITAVTEDVDSKDSNKVYQASVNKLCQNLEVFGNEVLGLHKSNHNITEKIQNLETDMVLKVNGSDMKNRIKSSEDKILGKIDENLNKYDEKLKNLEKKYLEKVESLEKKIQILETQQDIASLEKTANISDEILKKADFKEAMRVNELKVNEFTQILKKYEANKEETKEINIKLQVIEGEMKKRIKELQSNFEKIQNITKNDETKMIETNEKELSKQSSIEKKNLNEQFKKLDTKISEQFTSLNHKIIDIEKRIKIPGIKTTDEKSNLEEINNTILMLQKILENKIDVTQLHSELQNKVNKSEIVSIVDSIQEKEEKTQKLQKLVDDLLDKINKINQSFDKKMIKLKKDLDIESLIKQLKCKADDESVRKGFENLDEKMMILNNNLISLKREIDQNLETINKTSIQSIKTSNDNPFITIKSILPKACLSCGNASLLSQNNPITKKSEKAPLREKCERPFTAANPKAKLLSTTGFLPNALLNNQNNGPTGFKGWVKNENT